MNTIKKGFSLLGSILGITGFILSFGALILLVVIILCMILF